MSDLAKEALNAKYVIISLLGSHAGESVGRLVERKQEEVTRAGQSFWLHCSQQAAPDDVQRLCRRSREEGESSVPCIFVAPVRVGSSTRGDAKARKFSRNQKDWLDIPEHICATGSFERRVDADKDKQACAYALILGEIGVNVLDLGDYEEFDPDGRNGRAVDLKQQGRTTICCVKRRQGQRGESDKRLVFGVGSVLDGVWLTNRGDTTSDS